MKTEDLEERNRSIINDENFENKNEVFDYNFEEEKNNDRLKESFSNFNEEKEEKEIENILRDLNKAIQIDINPNNFNNEHYNECQEILSILQKPICKKCHNRKHLTYYKPLTKPKKINMIGKVLIDLP